MDKEVKGNWKVSKKKNVLAVMILTTAAVIIVSGCSSSPASAAEANVSADQQTEQSDHTQQQSVPIPAASVSPNKSAALYFTGTGGKGMSLTIIAIDVLDYERLGDQYNVLLSGNFDDDAGADLGHLPETTHIMSGNIGNEIQRRNAWKKLLEDAIDFYNRHPFFSVVFYTEPKYKNINYNRDTARRIS